MSYDYRTAVRPAGSHRMSGPYSCTCTASSLRGLQCLGYLSALPTVHSESDVPCRKEKKNRHKYFQIALTSAQFLPFIYWNHQVSFSIVSGNESLTRCFFSLNGVRRPRQIHGPKIRANVPPKGPCWRHRVCDLGAIVVAWAAHWCLGVGRI